MQIPEHFSPSRKRIVQVYIRRRSIPKTAEELFYYRYSSFVRRVVNDYRKWLQENEYASSGNKVLTK
jgi:hypothetical protein